MDSNGKEIKVGDNVIFIGTKDGLSNLETGGVIKMTEKMIFIQREEGVRQMTKKNAQRMARVI
jgi:hypothetical protein